MYTYISYYQCTILYNVHMGDIRYTFHRQYFKNIYLIEAKSLNLVYENNIIEK